MLGSLQWCALIDFSIVKRLYYFCCGCAHFISVFYFVIVGKSESKRYEYHIAAEEQAEDIFQETHNYICHLGSFYCTQKCIK